MLEVWNEAALTAQPASPPAWTGEAAWSVYRLPFNDLLFRAQIRSPPAFRSQSRAIEPAAQHQDRRLPRGLRLLQPVVASCDRPYGSKLMEVETLVAEARKAKEGGATRYCMGAAWRNPKPRDMDAIVEIVGASRRSGIETCMTLGMLDREQADRLSEAGLDYYNHNIDTSERYYPKVISTRSFRRSPGDAGPCQAVRHEGLLRRHSRHGRGARPTASTCW